MRTILVLFAIATLCFVQDAFAQPAPKEVIVVDGQVAVNNFPATQIVDGTVSVDNLPAVQDVWVQGATNPISVVDVTTPVGEEFFGSVTTGSAIAGFHSVAIPVPSGKLLKPKYLSVYVGGEHGDAATFCNATLAWSGGRILEHYFELQSRLASADDRADWGTAQFSDMPAAPFILIRCNIARQNNVPITKESFMKISYSGYLYDAPTP